MVSTQKLMFAMAGIVLAVLSLVIVFKDNGLLDLNERRGRLQQAVSENEEQKAANKVLFNEVKRLKHDEAYQEHVARQELGMIKSDEIVVKFHADMKK